MQTQTQIHPLMDIHFPETEEAAMLEAMKGCANPPWQWQEHDAFDRPAGDGSYYFHRDETAAEPPCTLCIRREDPGHLVVQAIVPDAKTVNSMRVDQYERVLNEFDVQIAGPAAEELDGKTSIAASKHAFDESFSPKTLALLQRYCETSGSDRDQHKWLSFLLHVHRSGEHVHSDIFGACLKSKNWWSEDGMPTLVHEYDFAMRLLKQADA